MSIAILILTRSLAGYEKKLEETKNMTTKEFSQLDQSIKNEFTSRDNKLTQLDTSIESRFQSIENRFKELELKIVQTEHNIERKIDANNQQQKLENEQLKLEIKQEMKANNNALLRKIAELLQQQKED